MKREITLLRFFFQQQFAWEIKDNYDKYNLNFR